ncbi:MAG: hypothetical protein WED82_01965 [Balneolales bacterium]
MSKRALYNDEAARLFIYDGYTLSQLEEYFKGRVSARSLWGWKEDGRWDEKKKKQQQNQTDVRGMVVQLAKIALRNAIDDPDPQNIYAAMAAVGRIGQKNFLEIISGLEGGSEVKEEKPDIKDIFKILQDKLEGK